MPIHEGLDDLISELRAIRGEMTALHGDCGDLLTGLSPQWAAGGLNLLHYLALRRHDIRPLQARLAELGLSSLGRAEGSALAALDAVLANLDSLREHGGRAGGPIPLADNRRRFDEYTVSVLGPKPTARGARIMVTMPGEAAGDYPLVRDLTALGMDCMRINCAHDGPDEWSRMIGHLRRAERETGRTCRLLMDLCGPKLRTGPLPAGPRVVKIRPTRDDLGRVTAAAAVWLTAAGKPSPVTGAAVLPVGAGWLAGLAVGSAVKLRDARDARREWVVESVSAAGALARADRTAYVATGTTLRSSGPVEEAVVGVLPPRETRIALNVGDRLVVRRGEGPGSVLPAEIGCTLPEVFGSVTAGDPIWFDDGKFGGVIRETAEDRFTVEITHTPPGGGKLAADKGINLPDTALAVPSLTPKDLADLPFVAEHADLLGYSFVRTGADVRDLHARLAAFPKRPGVVLKIETKQAFDNLPELLLAAMRGPAAGVMIARGDLAVECGFERLAEVQEEMLWLCEAAHMPVIWATQVLENLSKFGQPSRAEITDAAMGERAECVMLNKGPHVREAVKLLDGILRRMQAHQDKKRAMLRRLGVAAGFDPKGSGGAE